MDFVFVSFLYSWYFAENKDDLDSDSTVFIEKMRPVGDFTRPEVFLEEKSWPGLAACSQRPVLLIICEHTLQAHYHKEANTEGTHEIKVSLLKVIHIHV